MKRLVATILLLWGVACNRAPDQPMPETSSMPPAAGADMGVGWVACGAVVDVPHGNAELILFNNLALFKPQKNPSLYYPQISIWEPQKWKAGTKLRVRFLDGDTTTRAFVMDVATEWTEGLTLGLSESSAAESELRVTFAGTGVWSKVGKQANIEPLDKPTMGLAALLQSSDPAVRRAYVLHEFGHALGALHEHQRPDAPLTWVRPAVYAYYLNMYRWSESQVDQQVILPFQYGSVVSSSEFDRASVMMYPIHKEFTKERFVQPWNSELTKWDRQIMASMYK
jgi:hypothetical protein